MNYDISNFHPLCSNKVLQPAFDGKIYVFCPTCGVLADVEAIGAKIAATEACKAGKIDRVVMGDQTAHIDKGAIVE